MTEHSISTSQGSPSEDGSAARPQVLVVDDEKTQRDLLTAVLSPACRVDTAASVSEAVIKSELTPPALVIMDYAMPAASGIEGLQRLRQIYPQLPVVILTGHADLEIARQAIQVGAIEYILKPFDPADLLSVVQRLTTGLPRQDEDSPAPLSEIPYSLQRRLAGNVDLWRSRLPTIPSENRLVAVLDPNCTLEAKVLRLGRRTVQAEVYDSNAALDPGHAVERLEIWVGEACAYDGPATLKSVVSTGLNRVCEFAMSRDWTTTQPGTPAGRKKHLHEETLGFIARWKSARDIRPEFMLAVAGAEVFFRTLREWTTSLEPGWNATDPDEEHAALVNLLQQITPVMNEALAPLETEARRVPEHQVGLHAEYLRASLHPLLLCSPFVHRCFTKPLGYPGDYGIMNRMLDEPFEGDTLFARVINAWVIGSGAGEAYRQRVRFLKDLLSSEVARVHATEGRTCQVLSLGCGAASEVQRFVRLDPLSEHASFTLLDFSSDAIRHARDKIADAAAASGRAAVVTAMEFSVQQMLAAGGRLLGSSSRQRAGMLEKGRYDVIYCAGLFDYLSDRICKRLLEIFWVLGAPGAVIVTSNFAPANPIRAFMDYVLDWRLIYRDEPAVRSLAVDDSLGAEATTLPSAGGVELFLQTKKPAHAAQNQGNSRDPGPECTNALERVA